MIKLCLLSIWIGKLPDNFELWKHSVLNNPTVDFYVITDNQNLKDEANLRFISMPFLEVKKRFQVLFDFKITLDTPYKLCDYKPLWGEAFREITQNYDFWGHMDMDLMLGDIRSFLSDELLEQYDKFFEAGCFILYRNTAEIRELYKKSMDKENMAYPYKKAFQCPYACYFDEYMGMSILDWKYGIKALIDQNTEDYVQDFGWQSLEFRSYITKEAFVFQWKDGKLYRYLCDDFGNVLQQPPKEYMLVHIQKRKMQITFSLEEFKENNNLWIVPNQYQLEKPQSALYDTEMKQQYAELIKNNDKERSWRNLKKFGVCAYIPHFFRSRKIRTWIFEEKGFF